MEACEKGELTDLTAKVVICEAFVEGNIRKALGHMTKRKSNVAQDFRSAKVQNLAQAMFALSVATLTFSRSYTQSRLAAKLQVSTSAESAYAPTYLLRQERTEEPCVHFGY